jgi:hypothetical protein
VLKARGFVLSPLDPCVMNKTVEVLLATSISKKTISWLIAELEREFDMREQEHDMEVFEVF